MSNSNPYEAMDVITYPCSNRSWSLSIKETNAVFRRKTKKNPWNFAYWMMLHNTWRISHSGSSRYALAYSGPVFCLLLGVSSDYAQPITGQVTEVTYLPCDWPSTAWAYSEQETENGPWCQWGAKREYLPCHYYPDLCGFVFFNHAY